MEVWKAIAGFEGLYEVSNCGNIKSLQRNVTQRHRNGTIYTRLVPERIMNPYKRPKQGYVTVSLHKNGVCAVRLVHRLVAEAFIENPDDKQEVNHIDGNKANNRADNLEWCTAAENQAHSIKIGLRKGSQLHGGGNIWVTKQVNDAINQIVRSTGMEKWEVTNELLLSALNRYN